MQKEVRQTTVYCFKADAGKMFYNKLTGAAVGNVIHSPVENIIEELEERVLNTAEQRRQEAQQLKEELKAAEGLVRSRAKELTAQNLPFSAAEFKQLAKAGMFDDWKADHLYAAKERFVHEQVVYESLIEHTSQAHQVPGGEGMLAVYRPLSLADEAGAADGSLDNPFTFVMGMDVASGLYYLYEDKKYLATAAMIPCVWAPGTAGVWQWQLVEE